jgi:hypothetical protein
MITFVEYYSLSTGYPTYEAKDKRPIPVCGDRGIIILDGRLADYSHHVTASHHGHKRGFVGYRICKGRTIARGVTQGDYVSLEGEIA